MKTLILITALLSLSAFADAPKMTPAFLKTGSTPSPAPTPTPSLIVMNGANVGKGAVEHCYGSVWANPALKDADVSAILKNKFLLDQGKALCLMAQPACKEKCVPLMVNGRTK